MITNRNEPHHVTFVFAFGIPSLFDSAQGTNVVLVWKWEREEAHLKNLLWESQGFPSQAEGAPLDVSE